MPTIDVDCIAASRAFASRAVTRDRRRRQGHGLVRHARRTQYPRHRGQERLCRRQKRMFASAVDNGKLVTVITIHACSR